jgi:hypothetical protein
MSQFATAAELRDFMEISGTTGRKSNTNLDLILQFSSNWLERRTGRTITATASNTPRTFTTNGNPYTVIPDLRTASSVTLQTAPLTADSTYWLVPSRQAPAIYTGIQVRPWGSGWNNSYLSNPEWFDRNLDSPRARNWSSLPNDLVITGLWGWTTTPPEWKLATMALSDFVYGHADAIFSSAKATPEGNLFDMNRLPVEVRILVDEWELSTQVEVDTP